MVTVNVDLESSIRKRDKLKRKVQKVFKAKGAHDGDVILKLKVKIDNVEQRLSRVDSDMSDWNESIPL